MLYIGVVSVYLLGSERGRHGFIWIWHPLAWFTVIYHTFLADGRRSFPLLSESPLCLFLSLRSTLFHRSSEFGCTNRTQEQWIKTQFHFETACWTLILFTELKRTAQGSDCSVSSSTINLHIGKYWTADQSWSLRWMRPKGILLRLYWIHTCPGDTQVWMVLYVCVKLNM